MGRELQKKKNKSSIPKIKHQPKSKRLNVLGNAIVASNWDSKLTLSQNYRRLGLTSKLNGHAGGIEKLVTRVEESSKPSRRPHDPLSVVSNLPTTVTPTEARIERDPSSGAIIRLIRSPSACRNPLNDPLNKISADEDENSNSELNQSHVHEGIISQLEEQASLEVRKRPRQQSSREEEWISTLVAKYGDDYGRMMRDRRLNTHQQSEGDLRRRVNLWKQRNTGSDN